MVARQFVYGVILSVSTLVTLTACDTREEARRYELQGQIVAIRPELHEVLIKHGDIKNFMPGMTMPFKVRDATLLSGKEPGDLVNAQLVVGSNEAWLTALEKTGTAPLEALTSIPSAAFVAPLKPGDMAPDTTLTDHTSQSLSLSTWRGRAVAVTFIYVRCPLPQFCPMMDRRFAELQRALKADPQLTDRVRLLSVSFDPEQDTPAALAAHAAKLDADSTIWRFAAAPRDVVDRFAAQFGVTVIREADRTITHNLRTAVIAPDGRVTTIYDGNEWTAAQALDDLRASLAR